MKIKVSVPATSANIGSGFDALVSGENLCTMTDYTGFDPEVGNYGLDGGVYPVARSFSLGLNFNF